MIRSFALDSLCLVDYLNALIHCLGAWIGSWMHFYSVLLASTMGQMQLPISCEEPVRPILVSDQLQNHEGYSDWHSNLNRL